MPIKTLKALKCLDLHKFKGIFLQISIKVILQTSSSQGNSIATYCVSVLPTRKSQRQGIAPRSGRVLRAGKGWEEVNCLALSMILPIVITNPGKDSAC